MTDPDMEKENEILNLTIDSGFSGFLMIPSNYLANLKYKAKPGDWKIKGIDDKYYEMKIVYPLALKI